MAHNFDSNVSFGNDNPGFAGNFRALRHPLVVLSHIGFRGFAIFIYVFANVFFSSFIQQFLVILFLLSADFWTVKNVTGRLLVGLRWWNFVDAEGHNHWKFESSKDPTRFDPFERSIFWLALVTAPAFWVLLVCLAFVTFNWTWMVVALMGAAMTGANLYGYLRCRWSSTDEFTNYFTRWAFFSMLTRSNQAQQNPVPQGPLITA
uniref:Golgi apparatus membrane protein TVP23 homolog n=1 Tax=Panagrellus redivivus TaxID=6233 RepID=A0A7E4V4X2_PANRE